MIAGPIQPALRLAAFVAALVACCAFSRAADEAAETLILSNGDRVAGTSLGVSDGTLLWQMTYGAELSIPLELVDGIDREESVAEPLPVADSSPPPPDPEVAKELEPASSAPHVDAAVEPASGKQPAVIDEPVPLVTAWMEAAKATYVFLTGQTSEWTKRFELGGTRVDGNSETSEAYIGGVFERQFEHVFHQLEWNGRHGTAGSVVTQSRWQFNGTTDLSKDSKGKWILFATHRHLFDQLADLNYRGTYASGVGYRFVNEGDKRLIARLGPGATVEKYDPPLGTRVTPDLFAEAEAKWPVYDRTLLEYKSTFTPSLDDLAVFRVTSNYGVLVKLDEREAWAMRLGLRHEHNSRPNPGTKEDDFTSMFSVVYSRK